MITVGVDEVGRGCWAGPVVAGAVILGEPIDGLKDSKVLSKTQREQLSLQIKARAVAYGLGWVAAEVVDKIGLTAAVALAMQQAVAELTVAYDEIIIDGSYNFLPDNSKASTLVRADALIPAASAASILAKVARDDYMAQVSELYPEYGFAAHVGYGTAQHRLALQKHGITQFHRKSYKPIQALLLAD